MIGKKGKIAILLGTTLASLFASVSAAFSWFVSEVTLPDTYSINANSAGAYFAYGTGTADDPYGISIPRHLYNLAWLQYNGMFNADANGDGVIDQQYYFELAKDIDCDNKWTLPPIGTEDNPFVGQFNGNGHIISELTVSNPESFTKKPNNVSYTSEDQPEIVGLFGVVGGIEGEYSYTYTSSINQINDVGLSDVTVETKTEHVLVGILAGYVNGAISNVAVNESSIKINYDSGNTSYLDSGLTTNLSDYGTVGYATKKYKKSIKKIEEDLYGVSVAPGDDEKIDYSATEVGDDTGWGGSLNMKTIYYRLVAIRKNKATDISANGTGTLAFKGSRTYYDGVEDVGSTSMSGNAVSTTNQANDGYFRYQGANESGHDYIGNYNIYAPCPSKGYGPNTRTTDQSYMYLCGGHYETRTYKSYYSHQGYRITDGTNYLTYNGSTFTNTTDSSSAIPWHFVEVSTNVYYIRYNYESVSDNLYLYNNGNSLAIGSGTSTNNNAKWNATQSNGNLTLTSVSNSSYKIMFYSGTWKLVPTTNQSDTYYYIKSGDNYISASSVSGSRVSNSDQSGAAHFYVDGSNNLYFLDGGGNPLYLAINYTYTYSYFGGIFPYTNVDSETYEIRVINAKSQSNYYYFTYSGGTFVSVVGKASGGFGYSPSITNTNTYLTYSSGWEYSKTSSVTPTQQTDTIYFSTMYLNDTLSGDPVSTKGPGSYQTSADTTQSANETHMYYTAEDTTYFPLNVEKDVDSYVTSTSDMNAKIRSGDATGKPGDLDPKNSNTGYIVSGSRDITSSTTSLDGGESNIRISEYSISNINNSYNKSANADTTIDDLANSSIYTYKIVDDTNPSSGISESTLSSCYNKNTYPRYVESKQSFFDNSLTYKSGDDSKANANVYGLHFMPSTISTNSLVNASKVSILGNKCGTYQLPVDSIDFNLKQKGNVNFFAGTYFSNNDSFFSLHEVFRNNDATGYNEEAKTYTSYNTISEIKEIEEIWSADTGTKTSKYANIYKYKDATGDSMYSVPYRLDGNSVKHVMNKNNTIANEAIYSYATMNSTDFASYVSTYQYKLRFMTSQIGKQNSTYTTNRIYYFEFPMNAGEYCLGSVTGGIGAYLLYLDIGANAAQTQRTMAYEHYQEIQKVFEYPAGVAIVEVETVAAKMALSLTLDEKDTANMLIKTGSKGTLTITRDGNDVEVQRTGTNFTNAAKPTLVGDQMWDSTYNVYNIHDPGGSNLTDEIISINTIKDTTRLMYLDFNVNLDDLTKTIFTDDALYNAAMGTNVNGTVYYANRGYMTEATIYDLPDGSVSVSSYYVDDGNGGYVIAPTSTNVHGVHYYTNSSGSIEVTVRSLANDTTSVFGLYTAIDSIIREGSGNNMNGVHYYSNKTCTTEVKLSNLPSGTISVTSYYVSNGGDGYISATGTNVNGTTYYLDNKGKNEVTLGDLPTGTVIVDNYYTKEETGRSVAQYYQNGTSTTDLESMKVYNHNDHGNKYDAEDLMDPSIIATYDESVGIDSTLLTRFEFVVNDRVGVTHEWVFQYIGNEENTLGTYYAFNGYVFETTVDGGSITIKVLSVGSESVTIKDLSTGRTTTISTAGQTIVVPIPAS